MSKEERWTKCGKHFFVGDVIRWKQPIWSDTKGKRGKKKATKKGERLTTAAVLEFDNRGYARLCVRKDEIIANKFGVPLELFKKDDVIVRKRETIEKGNPERLDWSDETARPHAVSRFLR
jgi:hypothetical protein